MHMNTHSQPNVFFIKKIRRNTESLKNATRSGVSPEIDCKMRANKSSKEEQHRRTWDRSEVVSEK